MKVTDLWGFFAGDRAIDIGWKKDKMRNCDNTVKFKMFEVDDILIVLHRLMFASGHLYVDRKYLASKKSHNSCWYIYQICCLQTVL